MNDARARSFHLLDLLRREQGAMAEFLLALAAFDRSRGWVALGYTSLFHYLHRELKLSAGAAFHRKTAAELIQRFPEVAAPLRDGRLCLSSVCELAKVLTPENREELLPRFFHASKQEAKAVAAEVAPREVVPQGAVVTAVSRSVAAMAGIPAGTALQKPAPVAPGELLHPGEVPPTAACQPPPRTAAPTAAPRASAEPLTADLRRLHVTVSKRFMEKLKAAKDALSHSHPGADVEAILEAGLDALLDRAAKRRGLVERPRKSAPPAVSDAGNGNSRYVTAAVRREVRSATAAAANGRRPMAASAARPTAASSITSSRSRGEGGRRPRGCESSAESTTTSRRGRPMATRGWTGSQVGSGRGGGTPLPASTPSRRLDGGALARCCQVRGPDPLRARGSAALPRPSP